jgi:7-cyano-7-deazaguanine synthase
MEQMPSSKPKCVVLLSGGLDSSTLLAYFLNNGYECLPIGFRYGQRHTKELTYAAAIAQFYNVPFKVIDLTALRDILPSAQTNDAIEIPEGHYADSNMKLTVTPNRNMIMLSIATAYAITSKALAVAYAAHKGDHAIYPDCRAAFIWPMREALEHCDYERLRLLTPFMYNSKADIVLQGINLRVPYKFTWSCYNGREKACGKCGTCVERLEAFSKNSIEDPLAYEDREYWKTVIAQRKGNE